MSNLKKIEEALPALDARPVEGETIMQFGDRLGAAFTEAFKPMVDELKETYTGAIAVMDNPDTLLHVKEGHQLASKLDAALTTEGRNQRRPFNDIVKAHKAQEDALHEEVKPIKEHLKAQVDSIERYEQEQRRNLTNERVKMLEDAGFTRMDGAVAARMVVLMYDAIADMSEKEFTEKLEAGKAELAAEAARNAAIEEERKRADAAEKELAELRAKFAALEAVNTHQIESPQQPEAPTKALTPVEELQLPQPKAAAEPAPQAPEPAPTPTAQARAENAVKGPGLSGERTGAPRGQDYVNGFARCRELAVAAVMNPENKSKTQIAEAIRGLA